MASDVGVDRNLRKISSGVDKMVQRVTGSESSNSVSEIESQQFLRPLVTALEKVLKADPANHALSRVQEVSSSRFLPYSTITTASIYTSGVAERGSSKQGIGFPNNRRYFGGSSCFVN